MKPLKIAVLQIAPVGTCKGNLQKGLEACQTAKEQGADIALFPEMWSCGYHIFDRPVEEWTCEAIDTNDEFIEAFALLAKQLNMAIGITFLEQWPTGPKNSLILFDRHGQNRLHYSKVHTCDFDIESALTPGDGFSTVTLDTAAGPVKIGAMICYDREFPESARILMLQGAEIILVPNACPMEINRLSQLRARAFENMVGIVTCNYPASVPDCNGHSTAFDGIAYLPDSPVSRDTCILDAGEQEGISTAVFDLDALRTYRETEVHGNAFRHPKKYHLLVSTEIHPPFIRKKYRG